MVIDEQQELEGGTPAAGSSAPESAADDFTDGTPNVVVLQDELRILRRRLQDAPKRVRTLEERLLEIKGQLARAMSQNERLASTLREARERIAGLREEVEKLTSPPSGYGTVLGTNDDGTIDIYTSGRKMRVEAHPDLEEKLDRGTEVVLNEAMNVVMARPSITGGSIVTIVELIDEHRCVVSGRADEERVVMLGEALQGVLLRQGDAVRVDNAYEVALRNSLAPRSNTSPSKKSPTSAITTSAASTHRSKRSPMPWNSRSCTRICSSNTSSRPQRASCFTALPAAVRH